LVFSVGADHDNVAVLVPVLVPEELDDAPLELLLELLDAPPELLELELELELELLEPAPELLELPLELLELLAAAVETAIVAEAGLPNSSWPSMLVKEIAKSFPPAELFTGTITVLALASPSLQVTLPWVAM
jgi:hypothetical protein